MDVSAQTRRIAINGMLPTFSLRVMENTKLSEQSPRRWNVGGNGENTSRPRDMWEFLLIPTALQFLAMKEPVSRDLEEKL